MARKIKSACRSAGKRFLKLWSTLFAFFLGLFGMNCPLYGIVAEYGMPYAEFTIKGKVTSVGEAPIQDIKTTALDEYENVLNETDCYTNTNGDYSITFITMGAVDMDVIMRFEDIDGTENGSYAGKDVSVEITENDFDDDTPGNEWDDGDGFKILDVKLDSTE